MTRLCACATIYPKPSSIEMRLLILLMILLVVILLLDNDSSRSNRARSPAPVQKKVTPFSACTKYEDAQLIARDIVKEKLLSPSTADFPWSLGTVDRTYHASPKRCVYRVRSYVDAQNAFGAILRNKYWVTLVHFGGNDWKIDTVQMY